MVGLRHEAPLLPSRLRHRLGFFAARLRFRPEYPRLAPALDLHIAVLVDPRRHIRRRQVRQRGQGHAQLLLGFDGRALQRLAFRLQPAHLVHDRRGIGSGTARARHLVGQAVALGLELFRFRDAGAAMRIQPVKIAQNDGGVKPSRAQALLHQRQVAAQQCQIVHTGLSYRFFPVATGTGATGTGATASAAGSPTACCVESDADAGQLV